MSSQYEKYDSFALGRLGGAYVSDTTSHTGEFGAILTISGCTFTTLTGNITNAALVTLPAGGCLFGYFTTVQLATGDAVLYNAA
jgi:hypothetical protein